jgi:ATP-dependent DNA helicase RecG
LLSVLGHRARTAAEIMRDLEMNHRPTLRDNYMHPALQTGLVEMTVPGKPNSRLQKYRLTEKGRQVLKGITARAT